MSVLLDLTRDLALSTRESFFLSRFIYMYIQLLNKFSDSICETPISSLQGVKNPGSSSISNNVGSFMCTNPAISAAGSGTVSSLCSQLNSMRSSQSNLPVDLPVLRAELGRNLQQLQLVQLQLPNTGRGPVSQGAF